MRTILLWQDKRDGSSRSSGRVGSALFEALSQLFSAPLYTFNPQCSAANVVLVGEEMRDWRLPFFESCASSWAIAPDYPLDAVDLVESLGAVHAESGILTSLAAMLETSPATVLPKISPPFALVWSNDGGRSIELQVDGLGLSQLFEFDNGCTWAVTNRLTALEALGIDLEPVPQEWGVYAALGWFPGSMTGYRHVKRLGPGIRIAVHADRRIRTRYDILQTWIHAEHGSAAHGFERAADSVLRMLHIASRYWSTPTIGLSGGWDSRTVVGCLTHLEAPFRLRVKGPPTGADVKTAVELARRIGLPISVRQPPMPSERVADWTESADRAITWQAGHMEPEAHKRFFGPGFTFDPASVNVMGKHGEVARACRYRDIGIARPEDATAKHDWESRLVGGLLKRLPAFAPTSMVTFVREVLIENYREANSYGLRDLAAVEFFSINQRTRRQDSAEAAAQNALVITPLLTAETIVASFRMSPAQRMNNSLHRYILAKYGPPVWHSVDFVTNSDQVKAMHFGSSQTALTPWESFFLETRASRFYDDFELWQTPGRELLRAATKSHLVTSLFEREIPIEMARAIPDELFVISAVDRRFARGSRLPHHRASS